MKYIVTLSLSLLMIPVLAQENRKDQGSMKPYTNPFMGQIREKLANYKEEKKEPEKRFLMDYSGVEVPRSMDEFKTVYSTEAISQGVTNTCWSFSTLSFFETEVHRITKQQVHLSQSYIVYWEYVEKAKEFVRKRGDMFVGEGSEHNAVTRMMKMYGIVPFESFTGLAVNQPFFDHAKLFEEIDHYFKSVKAAGAWDENTVVNTVKAILKHHMGEAPTSVTVQGKTMSPQKYMSDILKLNPDDYVAFMSLKQFTYWTKAEYPVPDNWWHSSDYHNVPLNAWMSIIQNSLNLGYSVAIGGDVSEGGINSELGVAMVPTYDIPSDYIDENARQFRFSNGTTTDDHAVHIIGWCEKPNGKWYLIKDSGSSARNNPDHPGYYFYHEDYIKLKMMITMVHKDAVKEILNRFTSGK